MMADNNTPDFFRPHLPKPEGIRRLNNLPILLIVVATVTVVSVLLYSIETRQPKPANPGEQAKQKTERPMSTTPPDLFSNAPASGVVEPKEIPLPPVSSNPVVPMGGNPSAVAAPLPGNLATQQMQRISPEEAARREAWQRYRDEEAKLTSSREQTFEKALTAGPSVDAGGAGGGAGVGGNDMAGMLKRLAARSSDAGVSSPLIPARAERPDNNDPNHAEQKKNFLKTEDTTSTDYLLHAVMKPLSPYEMKAGTIIPAVMVLGINSDLPGEIIAQVRENVFDTATGQYLLIPQGSRLVGRYDNGVTYGQDRVLVVWNRIIFPDASSLNLGNMAGADQSGYAGFSDQVNNHYMRIFGAATMMSLLTAGVQLSQPQAANGENITPGQTVAGALGQQFGQAGMALMERNLQIQPTIEIRPGYLFNVMVSKDVVFSSPYQDGTEVQGGPPERAATVRPAADVTPPLIGPRLVGWVVRAAAPGSALVVPPAAPNVGPVEIKEGENYPQVGLGHVDGIFEKSGEWFIQTSLGWFSGGEQ